MVNDMGSCERCKYQNKQEHEEPCAGCTHNAKDNFKPLTNADRIRSMTDEELAEWLRDIHACCVDDEECYLSKTCDVCTLEWLKSEVGCE